EINIERTAPRHNPTRGLPRRLEVGNLSALEDTQMHSGSPPPPPMPMHMPQMPHMGQAMPYHGGQAPGPYGPPAGAGMQQRGSQNSLIHQMGAPPKKKKSGIAGALIGVMLFLVAATAAAAAYLSGFMTPR